MVATLCPTGHHWGGSVGVYNITCTEKATGEKVTLESNLHSHQVDVERRATKIWGERNPLGQPIRYYVDTELVGYYPYDRTKHAGDPFKKKTSCPVCAQQ